MIGRIVKAIVYNVIVTGAVLALLPKGIEITLKVVEIAEQEINSLKTKGGF